MENGCCNFLLNILCTVHSDKQDTLKVEGRMSHSTHECNVGRFQNGFTRFRYNYDGPFAIQYEHHRLDRAFRERAQYYQ